MCLLNLHELTSDLGLASALCCLSYEIAQIDRSNPRRAIFCFVKKEGIEEAIQAYWNETLRLSPLKLFTSQKLLKQRLYSSTSSDANTQG